MEKQQDVACDVKINNNGKINCAQKFTNLIKMSNKIYFDPLWHLYKMYFAQTQYVGEGAFWGRNSLVKTVKT